MAGVQASDIHTYYFWLVLVLGFVVAMVIVFISGGFWGRISKSSSRRRNDTKRD